MSKVELISDFLAIGFSVTRDGTDVCNSVHLQWAEKEVKPDATGWRVFLLSHSVTNLHLLSELCLCLSPEQPLINVILTWRRSCKVLCLHTFKTLHNSGHGQSLVSFSSLNYTDNALYMHIWIHVCWRFCCHAKTKTYFCLSDATLTYLFVRGSAHPHIVLLLNGHSRAYFGGSLFVNCAYWCRGKTHLGFMTQQELDA